MCELLSAVRDGREAKTRQLLSSEQFYNLPSWNQGQGIVLLREALSRGHTDIAKLLLGKGARVNNRPDHPTNDPLHFAVCLPDDQEVVSLLINAGAKINSTNGDGCTPLHLAVLSNNETASRLLLENQANPDAADIFRNTPLHVAAERGFPFLAELLLTFNAKPDRPLTNGFTPLHLACLQANPATVSVLLDHAADPNAYSNEGTPLDLAFPDQQPLELSQRVLVVEKLLKSGAKVNSLNNSGKSILHRAVEKNCLGIVAATVEHSNINAVSIDVSTKSLLTPIQIAALHGFGEIANVLISHGADINMPCNISLGGNYTPLHLACSYGHTDIARLLLENGADTEVKSLEGRTPLFAAIYHFKADSQTLQALVQLLVDSGANVETLDQERAGILHAAAEKRCLPLTQFILELQSGNPGCHVNLPTITGLTPLHMAAANGSIDLAQLLLSHGADINFVSKVPTSDGLSPLHVASKFAHMDIIKLFLSRGADVNHVSSLNQTPAHIILSAPDNFSHRNLTNAVAVLTVLLEHLVDIDSVDKNGNTILILGVRLRCLPVVETILSYKPNPKNPINRAALRSAVISGTKFGDDLFSDFSLKLRTDAIKEVKTIIQKVQDYGITFNDADVKDNLVLHHAICKGLTNVVQYLLDHGADFKAHSHMGTPLHSAVRTLHVDIVKILIQMGADVNAKDDSGNTPIFYINTVSRNAKDSQMSLKVARELLIGGADLSNDSKFLMIVIEQKNEELVKMALGCNADVRNVVASNGFTTVHAAVHADQENLVRLLIDRGAEIDARDMIRQTPLHLAVALKRERIANILLDKGADVNMADLRGYTILHYAAGCGSLAIVERLVKLGANLESRNNKALTPLLLAAELGRGRVVVALLRAGADPKASRLDGATVLHLAAERTDESTVETALYYGADIHARTSSGVTPLASSLHVDCCKPKIVQTLLDNGGYTPDMCCNMFRASRWCTRYKIEGCAELSDIIQLHFLAVEALQLWEQKSDSLIICYCRSLFMRHIGDSFNAELERLKSNNVTKKLTCFDIISKPKHQLVTLARNEGVVKIVDQINFSKDYPILGKLLQRTWTAATTREKLLSAGISSFNALMAEGVVNCINQSEAAFPQTLHQVGYEWILQVLKFSGEEAGALSNGDFVGYLLQIQFLLPAAVVEKVLCHLSDTELRHLAVAAPTTTPTSPLELTDATAAVE